MELQAFYDKLVKLQGVAIFDRELRDDEEGLPANSVQGFKSTENGIEAILGEDDGLVISKVIEALTDFVKLTPKAIVHSVYEEEVLPLKYVYEDFPIFIVEFELPKDSEWR
ncbi:hypothetical protein [Marinomonas transparens]|uniref:Uncharacterized protein n=1 Tax=Marinomonas transparens TaxID=2795388 RepID=A0A934JTY6_9GAMM|nr:hypothetical protein [Marinomonas transparens]MBJ7536997.1 hypothetical protein [Marinomonas transparens]